MDRNAKRRQKYAEMTNDKKQELLRRRRESRAAKKRSSSSSTLNQRITRQRNDRVVTTEPSTSQITTHEPSYQEIHRPCIDIDAHHINEGVNHRTFTSTLASLQNLPAEPQQLRSVPDCEYCNARRFYLEPPSFCCSSGQISIVAPQMPYALKSLFLNSDEQSEHFRKNVRTYNNNLAFTSYGARYDRELTKNTKGVYTFRVQGQVYHFLDSLVPTSDKFSGIQLYFFDTDEELQKRISSSDKLRENILRLIMTILQDNPYARFFRTLKDIPSLENHQIVLRCSPGLDQRVYNLPTASQVAAIWAETDDEQHDKSPHIQVYTHSGPSYRIHSYYACYDPLQYPLLFPRGESGWHHGIERLIPQRNRSNVSDETDAAPFSTFTEPTELFTLENIVIQEAHCKHAVVSAREYYCYRLQMRSYDESMLLHSLRLLQQFVVGSYIKIETSRLDFHRKKQNEIRSEILQGVLDSINIGQTEGATIGRRIVLPASFIGGPRDMKRRYLDAMALVQKYGKPDIFLTVTCNPMWKEIQDNLKFHEKAQDRPDLLSRVFRAKFEILKNELIKKQIFGDVAAFVYVIEFQKRGFPHAHLLLILQPQFKFLNPDSYDQIISAEIPNPDHNSRLYSLVIKHMIHGPCGFINKHCPCMRNGTCKSHYPKDFTPFTVHGEDSYPCYRRRDNGRKVKICRHEVDNRWVVPHNPYLLMLLDCHINVEICSTVKLVKYLYKYVFKGHDLVSFSVGSEENTSNIDEISNFQEGRWISPPEALWRIYEFRLAEINPSVYTLQVHLPDQQSVSFAKDANLSYLLRNIDFSKTMLTEFFKTNSTNQKAAQIKCLYRDFPQHFVWNRKTKTWTERSRRKVIGRLVTVDPREGERYYLRLLLANVKAPTSFDCLLTVDGQKMNCFRDAALQLGLLTSDSYIQETLEEAVIFQMPTSLRLLFATLLFHCSPTNPKELWETFRVELCSDYLFADSRCNMYTPDDITKMALEDINKSLEQMGKSLADYHFTEHEFTVDYRERQTKEVESEMNIQIDGEELLLQSKLNREQKHIFDLIMNSVLTSTNRSYFIDGPGGTGKTFLYRALLANLRSQGYIAIAVATSGVAASILPGGRTAHSRFKIPLDFSKQRVCQLSKQSSVAKLIFRSSLILWDEASMAKREAVEAFHSLLQDIMDSDQPFGGKTVVFGGDFRQTLPVIHLGTKQQLIDSSLVNSHLWAHIYKFSLTVNMRALSNPIFCDLLLRVGEGTEPMDEQDQICLPNELIIPYDNKDESLNRLLQNVFPDLSLYSSDPYAMINRCVLCPTNSCVDEINDMMIQKLAGDMHSYLSFDKTIDRRHQADYEDFLNSLNPKGLPPHKLLLKEGSPIMLLRNLNPTEGLCNGTRLICRQLKDHTISAEIVFGHHKGKIIFIPKIPLQSSENEKNGIPFIRTQFPVRLCFAMTINKSQGQTLDHVGIYLRQPVFSHGQLYVALSRARTPESIKVLIIPGTFQSSDFQNKTRNIVFREIFQLVKL